MSSRRLNVDSGGATADSGTPEPQRELPPLLHRPVRLVDRRPLVGAALRRLVRAGLRERLLLRQLRRLLPERRRTRGLHRGELAPERSRGSRSSGTSLGGVLVQLLRGPYALALDAASFLWSALFMLYAGRHLHVAPAAIGILLGVAATGTLFASAFAGPGGPGAALARDRVPLHGGVPVGYRPDVARHPRRCAPGRADPALGAITCLGRLHGRQVRRPTARHDDRGRPGHDDRRSQQAVDA